MSVVREAQAVWNGNIESGHGAIELGEGAHGRFNRNSRFSDNAFHNPETLAAGAQAGCYAMSLADGLAEAGFTPSEIRVSARVILEQDRDGQPFIPTVDINARAQVNNMSHDQFLAIADNARDKCPIANLFAGAEITLEADMIGG